MVCQDQTTYFRLFKRWPLCQTPLNRVWKYGFTNAVANIKVRSALWMDSWHQFVTVRRTLCLQILFPLLTACDFSLAPSLKLNKHLYFMLDNTHGTILYRTEYLYCWFPQQFKEEYLTFYVTTL